jgi:hypothetical protein
MLRKTHAGNEAEIILMISDHLTDLDSIRNWIDLEKMQGVSH